MFCSLVSFDFLFVFQETIRVRILFQSQVLAAVALCSKYRKKFSLNFSVKSRFLPHCAFETHFEFWRNVAHLSQIPWVQWRLNRWFICTTNFVYFLHQKSKSQRSRTWISSMNRDMYVSDGGYKRGQRNEKHTLFISTQPCMTLLIYKYAAMFIVEQLWQFHIFQSCLLSAVTSS